MSNPQQGLGQIARGQFARSFFEGFIEDLFLLFIRSAVPRERSFKSFFFILGGLTKSRGTFRASIEPSRSTHPRRPNRCETRSIDCFPKVCSTRRTCARHHRHNAGACQRPAPSLETTSFIAATVTTGPSRRCSMPPAPRFTDVACANAWSRRPPHDEAPRRVPDTLFE